MFQVHRVPARSLIDQLNQEKHDTSINARTGSDTLRNSPRGLHTSLEGGLNDVDLLSICKVTPVDQIVEKVVGKTATQVMVFCACSIWKLTLFPPVLLSVNVKREDFYCVISLVMIIEVYF